MRQIPDSSVVVLRVALVALLWVVTVACGTAAPVLSFTVPVMEAVCDSADRGIHNKRRRKTQGVNRLIMGHLLGRRSVYSIRCSKSENRCTNAPLSWQLPCHKGNCGGALKCRCFAFHLC